MAEPFGQQMDLICFTHNFFMPTPSESHVYKKQTGPFMYKPISLAPLGPL